MNSYAIKTEVELIVTHSYRFPDETLSNSIVDVANYSNHSAGFAIDLNIECEGEYYNSSDIKRKELRQLPSSIQAFINLVRQDQDISWGGYFNPADPVHFDVPLNKRNAQRYK